MVDKLATFVSVTIDASLLLHEGMPSGLYRLRVLLPTSRFSPTIPYTFQVTSLSYSYSPIKIMVRSCRRVTASYYIPYTSAIWLYVVSYTG